MRILASAFVSAFRLSLLTLLSATGPAAAKPTDAQLSAIKANCRSDFMSNCWGTPRGGSEAFQCLKVHMAKLSPGCQQAVKAAIPAPAPTPAVAKPAPAAPPPAPAAAAKPAATETPPAAEEAKAPPAATPESAPASPPKAAAVAPAKPAPAKPAKAEAPAAAEAPSTPSSAKAPAAAPAETPPIIGFLPPRKKLMVLRNCHQDLETYCADVRFGEGRNLRCLFSNKAALTPDCQGALARLAQ